MIYCWVRELGYGVDKDAYRDLIMRIGSRSVVVAGNL